MRRFGSPILGLDLSGRSPFSARSAIGLPPSHTTPPVVRFVAGQPMVKGAPLARTNKPPQDYIINPPSVAESKSNVQPSMNPGQYGNSGMFQVNLTAGIPQLVLKRPAKTRVELLIQNLNAAGNVAYNFDGAPSIAAAINIAPGGNRLWDNAVPQGDLWLIAGVNSVVIVEFINKDLTDPNT